ncbi:MAG: glycosyltransferase family 39 protein [Xanthobacteraceae bacterium]|nr:glycosyltransferase family 39 protein [Xanthobacteraceae bacterium]
MRFSSLIVELIRARPRLVMWLAVLAQAALWLLTPLLIYRAPPGDLAGLLVVGRDYLVGTDLGPPLAFWLADAALRLAGDHLFGVYALAQLCFVATFAALYELGRAIVGGPHAALAVLLTVTATAFGAANVEFGPAVLACPLWALILLYAWRVIGQGDHRAWFMLSIAAGLLLLTTPAAGWLLALVVGFALATARGRRALASLDPWFAALVVAALVLPYAVWLVRAGAVSWPAWPDVSDPRGLARTLGVRWGWMIGVLLLALPGMAALVVLNSRLVHRRLLRGRDSAPGVRRPPAEPLARRFVYFFALAPALVGSAIAVLFRFDTIAGGPGVALLMSGLAVVVATGELIYLRRQHILRAVWAAAVAAPALALVAMALILPWVTATQTPTSRPARAIAQFFGDSFQRRVNRPLPAVAGDPQLAALVALGASRPRLVRPDAPARGPWLAPDQFNETGGVVVWRASDTAGTAPAEIVGRFPGLVPEVPQSFDWLVNGRAAPLRVGWAVVRPKAP